QGRRQSDPPGQGGDPPADGEHRGRASPRPARPRVGPRAARRGRAGAHRLARKRAPRPRTVCRRHRLPGRSLGRRGRALPERVGGAAAAAQRPDRRPAGRQGGRRVRSSGGIQVIAEKMLAFTLLGAGWVLWLLLFLSVLSVGVMIERGFYFGKRRMSKTF